MIGAIQFDINDNFIAKLYPKGHSKEIDWDNEQASALGDAYRQYPYKKDDIDKKLQIDTAANQSGQVMLRLVETIEYTMRLYAKSGQNQPIAWPAVRLQNQNNKYIKLSCDNDVVEFQFVNYLGRSHLYIDDQNITFEVVPNKINYEDDYITLTEALAEQCAQILLEHTGATSNTYTQSQDNSKTLLEQFIFLRQFCYAQNLQGLFASIKRNPDRMLVQEDEMRPLGYGAPSHRFYTNPFSNGQNWQKLVRPNGKRVCLPSQIAVTHKVDSVDTVANRFLKAALMRFNDICERLITALQKDAKNKQAECLDEAKAIHEILDDILFDSFFDDVGRLDMMPQNNQVLQKREGYSQIFAAYSMIDLALQLDWQGKDAVYEGESKDVALLYEYWLFFELRNIIKSIDSCKTVPAEDHPCIELTNDGLTINLKQQSKSLQAFVIPNLHVRVNLYYNRTFSYKDFQNTEYAGSYSRPFRPDYTLAIFPMEYDKGSANGENMAVLAGAVSYVHFDAKYRIMDLTDIIGNKQKGQAENDDVEAGNDAKTEEELNQEKVGSVTNTYKRGDLLKMHTYNDAIRRTVGSYVLYPGSDETMDIENSTYRLYDEILPGVGAFAIKPSIQTHSERALRDFIVQLIEQKREFSSRLNRLGYYNEYILRDPQVSHEGKVNEIDDAARKKANMGKDIMCIGYLRRDYVDELKRMGRLKNGQEFLFYFHAIKGENVYSHHKDISLAKYFRFYCNGSRTAKNYDLEPFTCEALTFDLVNKQELIKRLKESGTQSADKKHEADFYYVMKMKVVDDACERISFVKKDVDKSNGNDSHSRYSPRVIKVE